MAFTDPIKNLEALDIQEGMSVVDLGAGSGVYTIASAAKVGKGGKVYAVDVQAELLMKIKNQAQSLKLMNVDVVHGNMEVVGGTRLREHTMDSAIVSNVLFQIEHKENFVAEIKRILKPGGKVLIIEWADSFGGLGPQVDYIVPTEKTQELFDKAGFSNIQYLTPGDHHYGFV